MANISLFSGMDCGEEVSKQNCTVLGNAYDSHTELNSSRIWAFLTIPVMVVGFIGNILVVLSIILTSRLRTGRHTLIACLSISNGPIALGVFGVDVYTMLTCRSDLGEGVCSFIGYCSWVIFSMTNLILTFIVIQQFMAVCWGACIERFTWRKLNVIFVAISLCAPAIFYLPLLVEVGGKLGFDEHLCRCDIVYHHSFLFRHISKLTWHTFPTIVSLGCFLGILKKVHIAIDDCNQQGMEDDNEHPIAETQSHRNLDLAKVTGICFILINVLIIPASIIDMVHLKEDKRDAHGFAHFMRVLTTVVSPIVYGIFEKNYGAAFKELICMGIPIVLGRFRRHDVRSPDLSHNAETAREGTVSANIINRCDVYCQTSVV